MLHPIPHDNQATINAQRMHMRDNYTCVVSCLQVAFISCDTLLLVVHLTAVVLFSSHTCLFEYNTYL